MKTSTSSLFAALSLAALLPFTATAAEPGVGAGALSTAQAADFSDIAPARSGDTNLPATNPSPGTLQPQTPESLNPAMKPEPSKPNPSSASGLLVPGATSGSTFGPGSNSTLEPSDKPAENLDTPDDNPTKPDLGLLNPEE